MSEAPSTDAPAGGGVLPTAAFLAALVLATFALRGFPLPFRDEFVYLPSLYKAWHPAFLAGDWTFSRPWPEHFLFNWIFGLPMLFVPLEAAGWAYRVASWFAVYAAVFALGRKLRLPLHLIALATLLWLIFSQGGVAGGDFLIGEFQAKIIAHVALLLALASFVSGRRVLGAILLGLSCDFHPIVAFWGCLGAGIAMLLCRWPLATIVRVVAWTALAAAPGIIAVAKGVLDPAAIVGATAADRRFYVLVAYPHLLDPLTFEKGEVVQAFLLYAFNGLYFRARRGDPALRFLFAFQTALAAFYVAGWAIRIAGPVQVLNLYFFRLFPPYVHLLFFFSLVHAYRRRLESPPGAGLCLVGLAALMTFGNPVKEVQSQVSANLSLRRTEDDPCATAMRWLATNTPAGSVAILPPWRIDGFFLSQRGQVASWLANRNDFLGEWRQRIEGMVGVVGPRKAGESWPELLRKGYDRMREEDVLRLRDRYGASYLVSEVGYSFPVLEDTGSWKVYRLPSP